MQNDKSILILTRHYHSPHAVVLSVCAIGRRAHSCMRLSDQRIFTHHPDKPAICRMMIKVKGIAPVMAMAFAPDTLPVAKRSHGDGCHNESPDQFGFGGWFRFPLLVIMLITNVPESALVTRKMNIKQTERKFSMPVAGKYSKNANSAAETSAKTFSLDHRRRTSQCESRTRRMRQTTALKQ